MYGCRKGEKAEIALEMKRRMSHGELDTAMKISRGWREANVNFEVNPLAAVRRRRA